MHDAAAAIGKACAAASCLGTNDGPGASPTYSDDDAAVAHRPRQTLAEAVFGAPEAEPGAAALGEQRKESSGIGAFRVHILHQSPGALHPGLGGGPWTGSLRTNRVSLSQRDCTYIDVDGRALSE